MEKIDCADNSTGNRKELLVKKNDFTADGIVLLAKKPGPTSFSSLNDIKHALGTKKVGHTGTLDSFAQGLLVVCTGRLTKLAGNITEFDKEYDAVIKFGEATDTLEYTGNVVRTAPLPDEKTLRQVLPDFTGNIMQRPPEFSAIHIDGKRASDLARSGKTAEIPERPVTVYKAEILEIKTAEKSQEEAEINAPEGIETKAGIEYARTENERIEYVRIRFVVSKGTYIRSLARDIAKKCGSAGHLVGLYRKKVGNFYIEDAAGFSELGDFNIESSIKKAEEWKKEEAQKNEESILRAEREKYKAKSVSTRENNQELKAEREKLHSEILAKKRDFSKECAELCGFDVINLVSEDAESAFKNGKPLRSALFDKNLHEIQSEKCVAVFNADGLFCGLIKKDSQGRISYSFVLN
ncbi:MAG: tRNA pseudouridine(55) synthase TruB [Treponema sp.]|nr:tRNA pseudouridine(55) synthase TruB [Treponema sp.]